jgi:subtilisin family serine protease
MKSRLKLGLTGKLVSQPGLRSCWKSLQSTRLLFCFAVIYPSVQAPQPLSRLTQVLQTSPALQEFQSHLFNPDERAYLLHEGAPATLAGAIKVQLRNCSQDSTRDLKELETTLKRVDAGVRVEALSPVHAQIHPEQWGLFNRGQSPHIALNEVESLTVIGHEGADIGLVERRATDASSADGRNGANRSERLRAPLSMAKIKVAVIDTGVHLQHPALLPFLARTPSECEAKLAYERCLQTESPAGCHARFATMDTDHNGYPLDCQGWNVLSSRPDPRTGIAGNANPTDEVGHGTHVAGIIASRGELPSGVVEGVATHVEILPVKVMGLERLDESEGPVPLPTERPFTQVSADADVFARGILYAIRSGAQVLNLSFGYALRSDSLLMQEMIALAIRKQILVVAAAGNQASPLAISPCRYPGVICVGSVSADGSLSHFSNSGDEVDIAAPGHWILSTWPKLPPPFPYPLFFSERSGYEFKSGTSMAAPMVAGAAATLLSLGYSPREVKARLLATSHPLLPPSTAQPPESRRILLGRIDLLAAAEASPRPLILPTQKTPLLAIWDRLRNPSSGSTQEIPLQLSLKNHWKGSDEPIDVSLEIESGEAVSPSTFSFRSWNADELKQLSTRLTLTAQSEGRLTLSITVRYAQGRVDSFKKTVEVVVPIRPLAHQNPVAQGFHLREIQPSLPPSTPSTLYRVLACSGRDPSPHALELLRLDQVRDKLQITLIRRAPNHASHRSLMQPVGSIQVSLAQAPLIGVYCMESQTPVVSGTAPHERPTGEVSSSREVRSTQYGIALGRRPRNREEIVTQSWIPLNSDFEPFPVPSPSASPTQNFLQIQWNTQLASPPLDLRFLKAPHRSDRLGPLLPCFLGVGKKPENELPARTPWDLPDSRRNPTATRLYCITESGLQTLPAPGRSIYSALPRQTTSQALVGQVAPILHRSEEFGSDAYRLQIHEAPRPGVPIASLGDELPLSLNTRATWLSWRSLDDIPIFGAVAGTQDQTLPGPLLTELDRTGLIKLRIFTTPGLIQLSQLTPFSSFHASSEVLAAFQTGMSSHSDTSESGLASEAGAAHNPAQGSVLTVFSRSRFYLYASEIRLNPHSNDLRTSPPFAVRALGQYDSLSRHLPVWSFGRSPLTAAVDVLSPTGFESRGAPRPGMLLPEGQGTGLTTQVLLTSPEISSEPNPGPHPRQLSAPAHLQTLGLDGCEAVDPAPMDRGSPSVLWYLCNSSHLIEVEL